MIQIKKPNLSILVCPICGESREVNLNIKRDRERKTCGKHRCSAKLGNILSGKEKINCKICNDEFEISKHNIQKEGNYCSNKCRKQRHEKRCVSCNKVFRADRLSTVNCSPECSAISVKKQMKTERCNCCKKEFERPSFTFAKDRKYYCSRTCAQRQYARENPNRYGKLWYTIRKNKVKKDNYTCEKCGIRNTEKYGIEVHHIIPITEFSNRDDTHFDGNLITLCIPCHDKMHD